MSKVFNMVGGGGKNISSIVITGLESTDTVTCTKDSKSYSAIWDNINQHWEIVGLPLGTITITATNGTKTITETVLIDIAGVYEITMYLRYYFIKNGDVNDIFSVFSFTGGNNPEVRYSTLGKQGEGNVARFAYGLSNTAATAILCRLDITNYSKIVVNDVVFNCTVTGNNVNRIGVILSNSLPENAIPLANYFIGGAANTDKTPQPISIVYFNNSSGKVEAGSYEYDISELSGEYYIGFGANAQNFYTRDGYMEVTNMYLE